MRKNNKGFAPVQMLLIAGILVIIGGAVYYVFKANKDVDKALTAHNSIEAKNDKASTSDAKKDEPEKTESTPDPTADWKTFKDPDGVYEFKHPGTWTFAKSPENCNPGTVLFGVNTESTGVCASGFSGQMAVVVFDGDMRSDLALTPPAYEATVSETVKIGGLEAGKYSATFTSSTEPFAGPQPGDKIIRYMTFYRGKTYTINYYDLQANNFPDAKADLDTLVTKTFKFL